MNIDLLKYHPQHIPVLARWFKEESPDYFKDQSVETIASEHFISRLNADVLPISFIAYQNEAPVGTVALLTESITTHRHLAPWLGALHVHPAFRHQGAGSKLVRAAVERARALGYERLYAGVGKAEGHYVAQGWEVCERVVYYQKPLSILRLDLGRGVVTSTIHDVTG